MQAYSIPYDKAMDMTLPQILMTSHSAEVNYERGQKRYEAKKQKREGGRTEAIDKDPYVASAGKRLSEMTTDEYLEHCVTRG